MTDAAKSVLPATVVPTLSLGDSELVQVAIALELTASDLYQATIDAGGTVRAWTILRDNHAAYAQRLSGLTGTSANRRNERLFEENKDAFAGKLPANAAFQLENTAAATQAALLGVITDVTMLAAIASIAAMESRQAAYFAERSGRGDNYDALFINSAAPLTLEDVS